MTTIAWDGLRLAGDRRFSASGTMSNATKIRRTKDGRLIGAAGCAGHVFQLLEWLAKPARTRGPRPANTDPNDEPEILEILPNGTVYEFDKFGRYPVQDGIAAIGSGQAYALAAMHLGKDAGEAVKIAALFDPATGGGVNILLLRSKA